MRWSVAQSSAIAPTCAGAVGGTLPRSLGPVINGTARLIVGRSDSVSSSSMPRTSSRSKTVINTVKTLRLSAASTSAQLGVDKGDLFFDRGRS